MPADEMPAASCKPATPFNRGQRDFGGGGSRAHTKSKCSWCSNAMIAGKIFTAKLTLANLRPFLRNCAELFVVRLRRTVDNPCTAYLFQYKNNSRNSDARQ